VHAAALRLTGLSDPIFQGTCLIGFVFVWHAVVPLAVLRWADKLSFQESLAFLSLRKFDIKGFFLVLPVVFVVFTAISLPYMKYVFPVLTDWIAALPGLNPPEYSIFRDPSGVYSLLPAWFVGLGLVGNFLCEELYFHGYLMKKLGFLGSWAWVINSKGTTTINHVAFKTFEIGDNWMSGGQSGPAYRTFHNGKCYELVSKLSFHVQSMILELSWSSPRKIGPK
jgi:membrane protease YdiL (CAAX protease family)